MRRAAVAGFVFLAWAAGPTFAADRDGHVPLKSAPAVSGPAWTGFYVGAHLGYGFANNTYSLDPDAAAILGVGNSDAIGSKGVSAGVLGGYNVLVARRWLLGVEADWSRQRIITTATSTMAGLDLTIDAKQIRAASLRGRFGYLVTPGTLLYGTAGAAWSKVEQTVNLAGTVTSGPGNIRGVQVGGGMETVLADNWHGRLEYLHTFYGATSLDPNVFSLNSVRPSVGLARVAAIYQLGAAREAAPWTEPVAATTPWTGLYVGGTLGGAVGYGDVALQGIGDIKGLAVAGPMPTVFVGYNYLVAPRWLVGAETELGPSIRSTDLKLGWFGAARGRFGFLLMPDTLIYASAGWTGTAIDDLSVRGFLVARGQHVNGVQAGGGIESAFNDAWSARIDYQYSVMNKVDILLPSLPGVATTVTPRGHVGRVAVVRRFAS